MSSSAVATLMTFVLRLSHGKCFKTAFPTEAVVVVVAGFLVVVVVAAAAGWRLPAG